MSKDAVVDYVLSRAAMRIGYYAPHDDEPGSEAGRYWAAKTGQQWLAGPSDSVWWCMLFVSMCLDECGEIDAIGGFSFNTDYTINKVRQHPDAYFVSVYEAQRGDVVIFDWTGDGATDHVGFVEKNLGGGVLQTIEGNTASGAEGSQSAGNGVWRRQRSRGIAYIIRPAYTGSGTSNSSGPSDITALQKAVRATPDNVCGEETRSHVIAVMSASNWGGNNFPYGVGFTQMVVGATVDGVWGDESAACHDSTVEAIQEAVGAEVDGIYGFDTNSRIMSLLSRAEIP